MSLAASLLILAAAGTVAAPPTPPPKAQADSHEAEIGLAHFADCVVRDRGKRTIALRYLRLSETSAEALKLADKLMTPDCLDRSLPASLTPKARERSDRAGVFGPSSIDVYTLSMKPAAFRNALYPALYRYSFGKIGPGQIADKPPLAVSSEWDEVPNPLPAGWRARRAIGDCMARSHPAAAHRFVLSIPWSTEETGEIAEITTALAECLPTGQTASVRREDLRGIVGEALYKLATAPDPPAQAAAG